MKLFFEMLKDDWRSNKKSFFADLFMIVFFLIQFFILMFFIFQSDIFLKICGVVGIMAFTICGTLLFGDI